VVIDEHLLLEAIRDVREAGAPVDPEIVSVALGATADDGGYWDVTTVADDLAELESFEPTPPAPPPAPAAEASESPAPPPNLNPAGHAPPGHNK
jgi:hypothetical protein